MNIKDPEIIKTILPTPELKELQQKVSNAQESLSIDEDVAKQEDECAWFRRETSRLDIHYQNMRGDMKVTNTFLFF